MTEARRGGERKGRKGTGGLERRASQRHAKRKSRSVSEATKTIALTNTLGLHMRPAGEIVKLANTFPCDITLEVHGVEESAKSVIGLIALEAHRGDKVLIRAKGARAAEAVAKLDELLSSLPEFDEKQIAEYKKAAGSAPRKGRSGKVGTRRVGCPGKGRSPRAT